MNWSRYFRRRYWDEERARELQAYLEIEIADNIARGMHADEAMHAARRKLGDPNLIREEIYQMNTLGFVETLWQDLRYGTRLLRRNPGFAMVAILSLALGIGANTAIFELVDAVRLRTLPVKNPQELAEIRIANRDWLSGRFRGPHPELTNPIWEQIRNQQQAFSGLFAWSTDLFDLARGGEVRFAQSLFVSGDFFNVLGVPPSLGRVFTSVDDRPGASPGAVISYSFWQREFGGEASALGKKLTLHGHPFEIIGVTPASFTGVEVGKNFDVAVTLCWEPMLRADDSQLTVRNGWWLASMGRLKPGWSLAQATAHLNAISAGLFEATVPPVYKAEGVKHYLAYRLGAFPAGTGLSELRDSYSTPLWLLMAIAGLVLLIACANLANLMLARASAREREIAVRLGLGASRSRLIRQLLSESLLLATAGAAAGVGLAGVLSRFLVSFLSRAGDPLFVDLTPDWRVLGFTAGLAMLTCLLFGLAPAVRATRTGPGAVLKGSGRGLTADRERFSLRRLLVVAQVALSLVLLVGALLFVRSLHNLLTVDTGFRQDGILIAQVDMSRLKLPEQRRQPFTRDLIERLRAIPGVDAAADSSIIPVGDSSWNQNVLIGTAEKGDSRLARISPGYFRTIETPLLAGRDFDPRDAVTSPKVAIVNQAFVRKLLHGTDPIGKTFHLEQGPGEPDPVFQIVGLVKDTKYNALREEFRPIAYFPASQDEHPAPFAQILIRSNAPLAGVVAAVKNRIAEVSPDISLDFHVFQTQIRESLLQERLMATLSGFFGLLAALLATVGLYGVMSYTVAQRRNEIGIRMALGATRGNVVRMILREAGVLLAIGLGAGTLLSLAAARTASAMLFGLQPHDPATLGLAIGALAAVALAASYLPAQRAAGLDPMTALRDE